MRRAAIAAALLGSSPSLIEPAAAQTPTPPAPRVQIDQGPMSLEDALLKLSAEAGVAVAFQSEHVRGRRAPALRGAMTLEDALARALADAPLAVIAVGEGGYALAPAPRRRSAAASAGPMLSNEIVVLGSALSRRAALRAKREAIAVIDALGPDELGQLPDTNAGESVDRLAGVSMLVEKGEGRYIQVRGLDTALNAITLNGAPTGSPEAELGGRLAPLDVFAAGILRGVTVLKAHAPNMDAQGVGGVIDLQTRGPFDNPQGFHGDATLRAGYEMTRPEPQAYGGHDPYAAGANLSFVSADGRVGAATGAAYSSREYVSQGVYQDNWADRGGVTLPDTVKNNYYVISRERVNLVGELTVRGDADDTLSLSGFYAEWAEYQHRLRYEQSLTEDIVPESDREGTTGANRALAALRLEHAEKSLASVAARARIRRGDVALNLEANAHRNELSEPFDNWEFRSGPIFGPGTWRLSGGVVTITPLAGSPDPLDASRYSLRRLRIFDRAMTETAWRLNASAALDVSAHLAIEAGAGAAFSERVLDEDAQVYGPGAESLLLSAAPTLHAGGFSNDTPRGRAPNFWLNAAGLRAYFDDPANANQFTFNQAVSFSDSHRVDYDISERVISGYALARYETARVEALAGLRVEATNVEAGAYALQGARARWREGHGDYLDVLPGALFAWRPRQDLIVRASVTSSLARQSYDLIAPGARFSDGDDGRAILDLGAPDLPSRHATSVDISFEWYPDPLSVFSIAAFYKDIEGEPSVETRLIEGRAITAELSALGLDTVGADTWPLLEVHTPKALGRSILRGVEINLQTQFAQLPAPLDGLGAGASVTFLGGDTTLPSGTAPLQGRPEQTIAVTVYYQRGGLDASVSYSYNGAYLTTYAGDPSRALDQGAFGRIDARFAYALTPAAKLFVEGVNLNNEPTTEFQGGVERWNTEYEYVGRTINAGVSVAF